MTISKLLVANRGEIAARVLRTAKARGLATAVLRHVAEQEGPAHLIADEVVMIDGPTPVAAYLDIPQIVAAATKIGADAVHPGYGFLSENAGFVAALEKAGVTFVGPTSEVIDLMGDKVRARAFVEEHGFPVAPSAIEDDDPATFVERARTLGYPLLIKPSAGGGGKGMRIVRDLSVLETEIATARSEGQRYFGDGRLYVERFIDEPRHIEVQVLGDAHGQVVHVFERECSVQRRFQKIVEESPAPVLSADERLHISETAAGIARAIGYRGAGTVEFIYGKGEFFFLEMNTRLQVEHPVTEEVTGIDLVAQQLAIAAGEPLALEQSSIATRGHAIELRIYAEDPAAGYLPTTGPILRLIPPQGEHVRWDGGVAEGGAVTAAFDPMIAKLIVWGEDREQAVARARAALEATVLLGCQTNVAFLRALMDHPDFVTAAIHTGYLDAHPEVAEAAPPDHATLTRLLAAAALSTRPIRDVADSTPALHAAIGDWRN